MFSYAFSRGSFYAIYILAGNMIRPALPNEENLDQKIGIAVMLLFVVGFAGSLVGGFFIDRSRPSLHIGHIMYVIMSTACRFDALVRYKKYKLIAVIWSLLSLLSFGVFVLTLKYYASIVVNMICSSLMGFFLIGLVPISFGFSGEMAYPESEATSSAILITCGDLLGVVIIEISKYLVELDEDFLSGKLGTPLLMVSKLKKYLGPMVASIFIIVCLSTGLLLMILVQEDLRRFNASNAS